MIRPPERAAFVLKRPFRRHALPGALDIIKTRVGVKAGNAHDANNIYTGANAVWEITCPTYRIANDLFLTYN